MNRILRNDAVNMQVKTLPTPNATPVGATLAAPGQMILAIAGGMTKLEQAAIEISARNPSLTEEEAVAKAGRLLGLCNQDAPIQRGDDGK